MTDKSVFLLENELNSELQVGALSKESAMWETFAPYNITKVFPKGEVVELLDVKLITHLLKYVANLPFHSFFVGSTLSFFQCCWGQAVSGLRNGKNATEPAPLSCRRCCI